MLGDIGAHESAAQYHLEASRAGDLQRAGGELRPQTLPARLWRRLGVQERDHATVDAIVGERRHAAGIELEAGQGGVVADRHAANVAPRNPFGHACPRARRAQLCGKRQGRRNVHDHRDACADSAKTTDFDVDDVEYLRHGDKPLLARVYKPRGAGPFPALVECHGGAWCQSDRLTEALRHKYMASHGVVSIALDFRSGNEDPIRPRCRTSITRCAGPRRTPAS